ncbi:DNA polymerase [Acidithiobacillus sp.]
MGYNNSAWIEDADFLVADAAATNAPAQDTAVEVVPTPTVVSTPPPANPAPVLAVVVDRVLPEATPAPFPAPEAIALPVADESFALEPATSQKKTTRKKNPVLKGFDADPRFRTSPADIVIFTELMQRHDELVLDFETTAITPWAEPVRPGPKLQIGDTGIDMSVYDGTVDTKPRARILSVAVPTAGYKASFDLDAYSEDDKAALAEATTGAVWIGHNLQFDYQWMLTLNPDVRPSRIIDTMLLVTACRPQADLEMQSAVAEQLFHGDEAPRRACADALKNMVIARAEMDKKQSKEEDGGAMPLQALSLWLLDDEMAKSYQKPHNWMLDKLSAGHYDYVMGDVTAPGVIARKLLKLPASAPLADLLTAIDENPGGKAYRAFEEAVHGLVRMQRTGVRWDAEAADGLDRELKAEAQEAADKLVAVAPALGRPLVIPGKKTKKNPFPDDTQIDVIDLLMDPSRMPTNPVRDAIAKAIQAETGRSVRVSDANNPVLDAKALAFDFPDSKIVKALAAINAPTKSRKTIDQFTALTLEGRLHPLVSIKAKTGRTAAQEPSLQQVPRDPRFRAVFKAPAGHQIIATDFSSIELRIAAALGVRAWRELQKIVAWATGRDRSDRKVAPLYISAKWLLKDKGLLDWLADDTILNVPEHLRDVPRPDRGAPIEHTRDYKQAQLCLWVSRIRKVSSGDEAQLPFRAVYAEGIDPHLLTAAAMEAQGGRLDLGGLLPLEWIRQQDQHALKARMKGPRQAAKAVNFGALYGQQAAGLHRHGVTGYGLSWELEDAAQARAAWFQLYPEIGLWHWLTEEAHKEKMDILDPYNSNSFKLRGDTETGAGKVFWGSTLSGRQTVSPKMTAATSFQDQGTGAEIALDALASLPPHVLDMLVNFVHDELVLEVPTAQVEEVQAIVERTMIASADKYLLPFGIPTEVESSVGNCWIH